MFPSTRTTPWKGGYAKFRRWSVALLRFYVLRCYNWLRAEGRIFRDRSSGKLTTRFRGVCQLYRISEILGHTRLDPQEPSKYVDRRVHTWRTVRRRKAKLGGTHTAADRNHRFDERNANTREDTSVLHLKMLRVWKSVVPSIRASLSLSLSLSLLFCVCYACICASTRTGLFAILYWILTSTMNQQFYHVMKNIWKNLPILIFLICRECKKWREKKQPIAFPPRNIRILFSLDETF